MRARIILSVIALLVLTCACLVIHAQAQAPQTAEIVYITGVVQVKSPSSPGWVDAKEGMSIREGDVIRTQADSNAELAFGEGLINIINVFPDSQLVISGFEPGLVKLEEGRVFSLIKNIKRGSTFEVRTPTAVAGARGTGWGVGWKDNTTEVQDFEKSVYIAGLGANGNLLGLSNLKSGWKTFLSKEQGPGKFSQLSPDEIRSWNRWLKEARMHIRDFKQKMKERDQSDPQQKLKKASRRARILERVERETTRSEENRRDRRTTGGSSSQEDRYYSTE